MPVRTSLAQEASVQGRFKNEIIPTEGHDADGVLRVFDYDEVIRPETTVEALSQLRPVFDPANGTVTAGTSSALSDGASGMLVMSKEQKPKHLACRICVLMFAVWALRVVIRPLWVMAQFRPRRKR
ncbi:3-ketoacyl-CoA thiolase [Alishewanella longhuensis]